MSGLKKGFLVNKGVTSSSKFSPCRCKEKKPWQPTNQYYDFFNEVFADLYTTNYDEFFYDDCITSDFEPSSSLDVTA